MHEPKIIALARAKGDRELNPQVKRLRECGLTAIQRLNYFALDDEWVLNTYGKEMEEMKEGDMFVIASAATLFQNKAYLPVFLALSVLRKATIQFLDIADEETSFEEIMASA